jgi:molybdate transport system substrate-binding protein
VPRARRLVAAVVALGAVAAPGAAHAVTVYAANSLREVLPVVAAAPTYSFLSSDTLALQIRNGAPADVFASANARYARNLHREGRCTRPRLFATNIVVLVVPKGNPARIRSVFDLGRGAPKRLAIAGAGTPIGAYTRTLLSRLRLSGVLTRNTVSSEPNVASIVGKVALGSADAGLVYITDHRAAADRLTAIRLPAYAQPPVRYEICAVRRPRADTRGAARFIRQVLSPAGRRALRAAGFGVPVLR